MIQAPPILFLLGALLALASGGCCLHVPKPCHPVKGEKGVRDALLDGGKPPRKERAFRVERRMAGGREFTVLIPPSSLNADGKVRRDWPAVVIGEEMPTIGPNILRLAERLGHQGYAVYLPVLFGHERENPGPALAIGRSLAFVCGYKDWQANAIVEQRRIVSQFAELCRGIVREHGERRIGVIGLCLTGGFPLELLAEKPEVRIGAAVVSQPSIPLLPCPPPKDASLGFPLAKLECIAARARRDDVRVLGFRFELDKVSPAARFKTLKTALGDNFLDRTLPACGYVCRDGCPVKAHAVLTDGYSLPECHKPETEGHLAWRRLVWFLDRQLKGGAGGEPKFNPAARVKCSDPDQGRSPGVGRVSVGSTTPQKTNGVVHDFGHLATQDAPSPLNQDASYST